MSDVKLRSREGTKQDHETPPEFMAAVAQRFGVPAVDLAATFENKKAPVYLPRDSLDRHWRYRGLLWLNPPFANIEPWARKCREEAEKGAEIALLTPASLGANWMRDHVLGIADVYLLSGRITFVGSADPYPKDCALSYFGLNAAGRLLVWEWRRDHVHHIWRKYP